MHEMRSDVALPILGDAMIGNVASNSRAVAIAGPQAAPVLMPRSAAGATVIPAERVSVRAGTHIARSVRNAIVRCFMGPGSRSLRSLGRDDSRASALGL